MKIGAMKLTLTLIVSVLSLNTYAFYYLDVFSGNTQNLLPPDQSFISSAFTGDRLRSRYSGESIANNSIGFRLGREVSERMNFEIGYKNLGNTGFRNADLYAFVQNVKAFSIGVRKKMGFVYTRFGIDLLNIKQSARSLNINPDIQVGLDYRQGEYFTLGGYANLGFNYTFNKYISLFTDFGFKTWFHDDGRIEVSLNDGGGQFELDDAYDPKVIHLLGEFHFGVQFRVF